MSMRRLLPLLLAAVSAACVKSTQPASCHSDPQCPTSSRCQSGVCVANRPPTASVAELGSVEAYALVTLDGSASHDPDPGDAVAEHVWTVRALDGACPAPVVATRAPRPVLRFGCAGRFEVSLVVRDSLGMESSSATREVQVVSAPGLARVTVGPDVVTDHVCAGAPLTCVTKDAVALAADTSPGLSLRWSVIPPADRPLDDTRRVRFFPDAFAARPVAVIETDGTPISGDWIFAVEATDAYGAVGSAFTRVSVVNRPPVVTFHPSGAFPHVFEPGRSRFLSSGTLSFSIEDPDGDPVDLAVTWRHLGDGGATFDGELTATNVSFQVEVPYAAPPDALLLRGGDELERRIELVARDWNGGEGRTAAPVTIGNRPPLWVGGTVDAVVPHRFDRLGSRYVAKVQAGTYLDPDGDPMTGGAGSGPCATVTMDGAEASVECSVPFAGVPSLDQLVGQRTFSVPVRDPWDVIAAPPVRTVEILDAAPTMWGSPAPATVGFWVSPEGTGAIIHVSSVSFDVTPYAYDPDGDPVVLTPAPFTGGSASPGSALLTGTEAVRFHFFQPGGTFTRPAYPQSALIASDGVSSVRVAVSPALGNF